MTEHLTPKDNLELLLDKEFDNIQYRKELIEVTDFSLRYQQEVLLEEDLTLVTHDGKIRLINSLEETTVNNGLDFVNKYLINSLSKEEKNKLEKTNEVIYYVSDFVISSVKQEELILLTILLPFEIEIKGDNAND